MLGFVIIDLLTALKTVWIKSCGELFALIYMQDPELYLTTKLALQKTHKEEAEAMQT